MFVFSSALVFLSVQVRISIVFSPCLVTFFLTFFFLSDMMEPVPAYPYPPEESVPYFPQQYVIEYDQFGQECLPQYDVSSDMYYNCSDVSRQYGETDGYCYRNIDIGGYMPYRTEPEPQHKFRDEPAQFAPEPLALDFLQPEEKFAINPVRSLSQLCPPYPDPAKEDKSEGIFFIFSQC